MKSSAENDNQDLRSPLARARDKWLASDECKMLMELTSRDLITKDAIFIRNRFERAFLAGAKAQEEIMLIEGIDLFEAKCARFSRIDSDVP